MAENHVIISQLDAEIISYLTTCHDYCDSYDIARIVGINRRQVRSEIANVKEILSSLGYTLDSKRSKGYRIVERDRITQLQDIIREHTRNDSSFSTPQGRSDFLMEMLVMNDTRYLKLDELADALYVSRSTINNDLQVLNGVVTARKCRIETRPRQGIRLTGKERAKRTLLCDCLYNINTLNNSHVTFLELFMDPQGTLEYSIMKTLEQQNIVMSDMAMSDFLLYLTVVCLRVTAGKMLEESPDVSIIKERREFDTASLIAVRISQYLGILLNEHEVNQIAIKIIANRSSTIRPDLQYHEKTQLILDDSVREIRRLTGIPLTSPDYLEQFRNYIDSALMILYFGEKIRNPFYQTIRENFPLAYDLSLIVKDVIHRHTGYTMSSSFMAFFTTFFNTWIQDRRYRSRRVLLISALGVGAARSIEQELQVNFGQHMHVADISNYHDLPNKDMSQFDMVISTIPISRHLDIPSVVISQFVTADDLHRLETTITSDYSLFQPELAYVPSLFMSGLSSNSLDEVRKLMTAKICRLFPKLKEGYVETMLESSQNYMTELGNGFLFVRLEKPLNTQRFSVPALLRNPLNYHGSEIRAVVLVSSADRRYYRALREASRAISRRELEEVADKKNPDYAEFIHLYQEEW